MRACACLYKYMRVGVRMRAWTCVLYRLFSRLFGKVGAAAIIAFRLVACRVGMTTGCVEYSGTHRANTSCRSRTIGLSRSQPLRRPNCATLATASPPFRAASLDPFGSLARGRVPSGSTLVPQRGNGALFYSQVWDIAAKRCTKTLRDAHPHFVRLDCCSHLLCDYAACRIGMGSVVKPLVAA